MLPQPLTTEQVWNAFHARLLHFIQKRVADAGTAEDILQDVFLKIHQQIESLKDVKKLESWVYQITRHAIIDSYRSKKLTITLEESEVLQLPEELPDDDIVSELFPSIQAMVNRLSPQDRQALILTEYQGLTQKELSKRLNISFSGAKSRVQRARQRLKQLLLACCHFELDTRGHILNYEPHCQCCIDEETCCTKEQHGALIPVRPFGTSFVSSERTLNEQSARFTGKGREEYLMSSVPQNDEQLREAVRTRYAGTALQVLGAGSTSEAPCCGPSCCAPSETVETQPTKGVDTASSCCESSCCQPGTNTENPITSDLYTQMELGEIPVAAALASLGCGNPTALAELQPGENVLDLGSGGGIDVLLSAKRVGPTGFAYGLDMTDPMLELAERNRKESGIENVQFLKGIIEAIPLPDNSVNVIISNCVINLSADKGQVLREAYRVLTSGGRFAVSDIVVQGDLPSALRQDMESWAGCIAGALEEKTYRSLLDAAGFVDIDIEVTRRYSLDEIASSGASASVSMLSPEKRRKGDGQFVSAFVRARKP